MVNRDIKERVTVIGTGTMGHSIALSIAWASMPVTMYGVNRDDIEKGMKSIEEKVTLLIENDLLSEEGGEQIIRNITPSTELREALQDTTFVIEAAPEQLEFKQDLFRDMEIICSEEVILASNTSSLKPTDISQKLEFPDRMVVVHFWNPAHLLPLVEVVKGEHTTEQTVERAMSLLDYIGKKAIRVEKEVLGFVGNRLQYALFREAQYLYEEGVASIEDIDTAVHTSIGRRLGETGPFLTADMGGLDVFSAISDYVFPDLSKDKKSLPNLQKLVSEGSYGQKSGKGYYRWDKDFHLSMSKNRDKELIRWMKKDMERISREKV
ncbi:3-hydroxyacyl-CoA dehydrogenase family protein [Bacillus sp. FJAT-44742]|uniref:3-hydroxyacyl-CoA dehydrogenase family protein n=1 Tax=Bacillus sp. FJAT-44742 TaxID=2014005 RepID=UPI000C249EA0|nr:3-hydroxyacyl-CoA dehydrogenase family protein [Bacillus sp. FJAT-44742]